MNWRTPVGITGHVLVALAFLLMVQSSLAVAGVSYKAAIIFIIGFAMMIVAKYTRRVEKEQSR